MEPKITDCKCAGQKPTVKFPSVLLGNTFPVINPIGILGAFATALNHPALTP